MVTSTHRGAAMRRPRATGWVGWIVFAAFMMVISGILDIIWGITGIARDQVFLVAAHGNIIDVDYGARGVG